MTKADLIRDWLSAYPQDVDHPDLEQMAFAGYVETQDGEMIPWKEYIVRKDVQNGQSKYPFLDSIRISTSSLDPATLIGLLGQSRDEKLRKN